jgi:hypothetical protein
VVRQRERRKESWREEGSKEVEVERFKRKSKRRALPLLLRFIHRFCFSFCFFFFFFFFLLLLLLTRVPVSDDRQRARRLDGVPQARRDLLVAEEARVGGPEPGCCDREARRKRKAEAPRPLDEFCGHAIVDGGALGGVAFFFFERRGG